MTRAALFARSLLLAAAVAFGASSAPADTPPSRQTGKVWYPLWYPPNAAALKTGSTAVEKAQTLQLAQAFLAKAQ